MIACCHHALSFCVSTSPPPVLPVLPPRAGRDEETCEITQPLYFLQLLTLQTPNNTRKRRIVRRHGASRRRRPDRPESTPFARRRADPPPTRGALTVPSSSRASRALSPRARPLSSAHHPSSTPHPSLRARSPPRAPSPSRSRPRRRSPRLRRREIYDDDTSRVQTPARTPRPARADRVIVPVSPLSSEPTSRRRRNESNRIESKRIESLARIPSSSRARRRAPSRTMKCFIGANFPVWINF